MQEFIVSSVVEIRRARIALMAGRTGSLILNGEAVYGTVNSVSPKPITENCWLVRYSVVEEPKVFARKKLKYG